MSETVERDVGDMKPGDVLKVADLPIASNKNIHLKTDPEAVVVSVVAPKNADIPEDEEAEGDDKDAKASK